MPKAKSWFMKQTHFIRCKTLTLVDCHGIRQSSGNRVLSKVKKMLGSLVAPFLSSFSSSPLHPSSVLPLILNKTVRLDFKTAKRRSKSFFFFKNFPLNHNSKTLDLAGKSQKWKLPLLSFSFFAFLLTLRLILISPFVFQPLSTLSYFLSLPDIHSLSSLRDLSQPLLPSPISTPFPPSVPLIFPSLLLLQDPPSFLLSLVPSFQTSSSGSRVNNKGHKLTV